MLPRWLVPAVGQVAQQVALSGEGPSATSPGAGQLPGVAVDDPPQGERVVCSVLFFTFAMVLAAAIVCYSCYF